MSARARILVVDDDAGHAQSVQALLDAHGYDVVCETHPERALPIARDGAFDVLLLDLNMPRLSGVEFLEALGERASALKTIVLSGATRVADVTPILRLGAYDYLTKPYEPTELVTCVRNAIGRVELERENARMKQAEDAANRRHEFLVNASPDLIYTLDADGRFSFVNGRLSEILGYEPANAIGKHWTDVIDPELHDALRYRIHERRTGTRATHHFEIDYPSRDGDMRVLELSAMGLYVRNEPRTEGFRGTYGILRDVTEPRRTARALAQSQQKFYGLFVNVPDAVFISRLSDGTVLECNDGFRRLAASIGAESTSDLPLWETSAQREAFVAELEVYPVRHQQSFERHFASGVRHLEVRGRIVELDGERSLMASVRDRTVEKQAELDRLSFEAQLQQSSKMEAIGQLAGGIAHDFNNILASIIGYTELALVANAGAAETSGYLKEVVVAGQRARDLISQMLTFTRAHKGHARVTSLPENIAAVARMLRAAIPRTIEIDTELDGGSAPVLIDPVQLQQIVINLLVNARDAIDGAGRISVRTKRVACATRCASCDEEFEGEYATLSVADTGHGIAPELMPRIFELFVSTREPGRGTGFGLWLIHTIVHEYNGHVGIATGPSGTTFNIYLPPATAEAIHGDDGSLLAVEGVNGHIMVVDDEVSMSNFIAEVLRDAGYEARVFNDGATALDHLHTTNEPIALLLVDQKLPNVGGLEIVSAARRQSPGLPIAVLTGYADRADQERLAQLGVTRVLAKPFGIDALLALTRELTERAATPSTATTQTRGEAVAQ
jgi:PAS domain S-box-containing protein